MMDRRTALTAIAAAPFAATPALATTADPAVVAYDWYVRAEAAAGAELDRINDAYPDKWDNNAAIEAFDAGPISADAEAAYVAACSATPTTIAGIACKARMVAIAQGVELDCEPDNKPDAWFHQMIADLDRMKNTPLTA